jgi:hypothetical protein
MLVARTLAAGSLALVTLAGISGCSSKPSEADARNAVEHQIQQNSRGLIKLAGFQKTNGKDMELAGVKIYEMEWTATLEFLGDCYWDSRSLAAVPKNDGRVGLDALLSLPERFGKQPATRGQRTDLNGTTSFERTEKGWRPMR